MEKEVMTKKMWLAIGLLLACAPTVHAQDPPAFMEVHDDEIHVDDASLPRKVVHLQQSIDRVEEQIADDLADIENLRQEKLHAATKRAALELQQRNLQEAMLRVGPCLDRVQECRDAYRTVILLPQPSPSDLERAEGALDAARDAHRDALEALEEVKEDIEEEFDLPVVDMDAIREKIDDLDDRLESYDDRIEETEEHIAKRRVGRQAGIVELSLYEGRLHALHARAETNDLKQMMLAQGNQIAQLNARMGTLETTTRQGFESISTLMNQNAASLHEKIDALRTEYVNLNLQLKGGMAPNLEEMNKKIDTLLREHPEDIGRLTNAILLLEKAMAALRVESFNASPPPVMVHHPVSPPPAECYIVPGSPGSPARHVCPPPFIPAYGRP